MKSRPLLHQNSSDELCESFPTQSILRLCASSSPCPLSLQSSSPKSGYLNEFSAFMTLNPFPLLCAFYLLMFLSSPRQCSCASQRHFPSWNVPSWVAQWSTHCFSSIHCSAGSCVPFGSGAGRQQVQPSSCPRSQYSAGRCPVLPDSTDHRLPLLLPLSHTLLQQPFRQSVLCPFLSTIMHLGILKGDCSWGVPAVPQVSDLAHMAVPCAPWVTIRAARQDIQILSPLAVTHSDIQEQSLQLKNI